MFVGFPAMSGTGSDDDAMSESDGEEYCYESDEDVSGFGSHFPFLTGKSSRHPGLGSWIPGHTRLYQVGRGSGVRDGQGENDRYFKRIDHGSTNAPITAA